MNKYDLEQIAVMLERLAGVIRSATHPRDIMTVFQDLTTTRDQLCDIWIKWMNDLYLKPK